MILISLLFAFIYNLVSGSVLCFFAIDFVDVFALYMQDAQLL